MANVDNPHGFAPLKSLGGGDMVAREYIKAAADGTRLGINDPVTFTGAVDTIEQYDQDDPILGVTLNFGAGTTLTNQSVILAFEDTLFEAQEDANMGKAAEGAGANTIAAVAANTTTGHSKFEISSTAAAAVRDLHLYQVAPYIDNDGASTNARWFILFNDRQYANAIAGI
jgi:hypothetical protein